MTQGSPEIATHANTNDTAWLQDMRITHGSRRNLGELGEFCELFSAHLENAVQQVVLKPTGLYPKISHY